MVFRGPGLAREIKAGLLARLAREGATLAGLRGSRTADIAAGRF